MPAANTPLAKPEGNEAPNAVDDLLAERERVSAELRRLGAIDAPVLAAEAALAAVDRAIGTLDADERSRSEEWAAGGVGEPPAPRNSERAGLVRRQLELQSDVDAARNRAAAVVPRRVMLNGELRRIGHLLFAEKLRGALEEARRLNDRAHAIAADMREPIARVVALKMTLMGRPESEDRSAQRLIGETIDALSRFEMPEVGGDPASMHGFITDWERALQ